MMVQLGTSSKDACVPAYRLSVNRNRKSVPCCCEVDKILSFLKEAKTPFVIRTMRLPSRH